MASPGIIDYKQVIGANIRRLRTDQGMSLRTFALMIGMDYTYLFDIEHGKANATIDALSKVASGLDIDLPDLFQKN